VKPILLVTDIFPPDIGGPATFIDRLAHAIAAAGTRATVVCTSDAPVDATDRRRPFAVRRVRRAGRLFGLRLLRALSREMLRHGPVLVNGLEYAAHRAARLVHKPYVMKIVGDYVWEHARNTSRTRLGIDAFQRAARDAELEPMRAGRERYLADAATIITPSDYLRNLVVGWGAAPAKVKTILNGVSLDHFRSFSPRRRAPGQALEVVFCGRLANWKGVETLLLAVQGLEGVTLDILGDGPELPMLSGLSSQLGLDGAVTFHGRIPTAEIPARMARAHVLVLASDYEGLSHTLIEASAAGLAPIASDRGGNPEVIVHGDSGLLIPYGDYRALRSALARLAHEEELRFALATRAKENSARFDFTRTVERTLELLASAA
jgi:glycosyltransferase involved in cell wall biosynthesis